MKTFVITAVMTVLTVFMFAQDVLLSEDFEGAFPGDKWTLSGDPTWDDESHQHYGGGWAGWCAGSSLSPSNGSYQDDMNAEMTSTQFSLEGARNATFSFWAKVNTESSYDYFKAGVYVYCNGDWQWNELVSISGSDADSWTQYSYSLGDYIGNGRVKVAFKFTTDGSRKDFAGAWVDDISVVKNDSGTTGGGGDEYEPNNSASQYTSLAITNTTQTQNHTLHNGNDQDWFRFTAVAGREYTFHSTGDMDTRIYLYNENGNTQIDENDDGGDGNNFRLVFSPDRGGDYKLKVVGYNGATGSYTMNYAQGNTSTVSGDTYEPNNSSSQATELRITSSNQTQNHSLHTSNDEDWFRFSAQTGKIYTFKSFSDIDTRVYIYDNDGSTQLLEDDDSGDDTNFLAVFAPNRNGDYKMKVVGYNGATGTYELSYFFESNSGDSYEPDNSSSQATAITPNTSGSSQSHSLHYSADEDWYRFTANANRTYTFYSVSDIDTRIYIYGEDEAEHILENDDGGDGNNFRAEFVPPSNGSYKIKVAAYNGATGNYELHYSYREGAGDSYEPDNSHSEATNLVISNNPQTQSHSIHSTSDVDWFKFRLEAGRSYTFSSSSDIDTEATLYQENGTTEISSNDDGDEGLDFSISFTPERTGIYKLKVFGHGSATGDYILNY